MSDQVAAILVVDDTPINRNILEHLLMRQGHTVHTAENGRQALDALHAHSFDLILLDIMMPVMNGYQVLEHIQSDPTLSYIPVVVISAVDDIESAARCIELGAEDYLFKPFNPMLLNARVRSSLAKKRLYDQEQAAAAALKTANEMKSEFVALVSHELKNPITAIRGYADTMLLPALGQLSAAHRDCLRSIRGLTDVMITLLGDLNDISQIEAGCLRLERTPTELSDVIEAALQAIRGRIAAKRQQLIIETPASLPPVDADPTRLVQILINLISNASKYTGEEGGITISATRCESDTVEIAVRDTGIGMSREDQHRVFERFFRAADEHTRKEPGTGLGLHITRFLVELHGGRIWFESKSNVGTSFYFTLPLAEANHRPALK